MLELAAHVLAETAGRFRNQFDRLVGSEFFAQHVEHMGVGFRPHGKGGLEHIQGNDRLACCVLGHRGVLRFLVSQIQSRPSRHR